MKSIPDAYKKVPMMLRAQVRGRSQLHYKDFLEFLKTKPDGFELLWGEKQQ